MKTILSAALAVMLALVMDAGAQDKAADRKVELAIEQQSLADALNEWAKQTGLQLVSSSSEMMNTTVAPRIKGEYTPKRALEELLKGTSLTYEWVGERAVAIREKAPILPAALQSTGTDQKEATVPIARFSGDTSREQRLAANDQRSTGSDSSGRRGSPSTTDNPEELEEVVVTGTNIKGVAPVGSPVIVINELAIRRSGYTSTEQLIQSLPQNVRSGAEGATADAQLSSGSLAGLNSTFGSGANLRGLGSGATLTLINGQRIAASSSGTYTDISLIPLNAIERVEILTDGASAIYGADAVAGVINIILKSDFDGLETRGRYGFTSPRGRDEIRLSQMAGGAWSGGSALIVLDYLDQTSLDVSERKFTGEIPAPTSIYPENEQLGVVLSANHDFGAEWSSQASAQYARVKRAVDLNFGDGTAFHSPIEIDRIGGSLAIAYSPSSRWEISLNGAASQEDIDFRELYFSNGIPDTELSSIQTQEQKQWSVGIIGTGRLIDLRAGQVSLALGVDRRSEDYLRQATSLLADVQTSEPADRDVDSAFVELFIPIVGRETARPGVQRLEISLAGRYDDYSDFGDTTNPKIGVAWMPLDSLELRASYSTSFRAPPTGRILNDSLEGAARFVLLRSFASVDGSSSVPVAVLLGSEDLLPEESENWTAGFTYKPERLPGLAIGATYYDISYTDRIISPPFDRGALSNAALQSFVQSFGTPTDLQAALTQLIGSAPVYLNLTGGAFGPTPLAQTVYVFDSRTTNAGVVRTSGVDLNFEYEAEVLGGALHLGLNANHIRKIDTVFAPGAATFDISNTTGNPIDWRFRTSAAFRRGSWDAALNVNYTDRYRDTTGPVGSTTDPYLTVDTNLRYTVPETASNPLSNVSFTLSVINLFDEAPPFVESAGLGSHYDSANADPLGRLIAFEITKHW